MIIARIGNIMQPLAGQVRDSRQSGISIPRHPPRLPNLVCGETTQAFVVTVIVLSLLPFSAFTRTVVRGV